jgi:S-DNA-T family DNA segregation ATPase FtsK/SpoIIIE
MAADTMPEGELNRDAVHTEAGASTTKPTVKRASRRKTAAAAAHAGDKTASAKANAKKPRGDSAKTRMTPKAAAMPREVGGLICAALALVIFLSVVSFHPQDLQPVLDEAMAAERAAAGAKNLIGPVGARVGDALLTLFGLGAFAVDGLLWYLAAMMLLGKRVEWHPAELLGQAFFTLAAAMLAHLTLAQYLFFAHKPGGWIGELGAELSRGLFGTVGTSIIALSMLLFGLMLVTDLSLSAISRAVAGWVMRAWAYVVYRWRVHQEFRARLAEEHDRLRALEAGENIEQVARDQAQLAHTPIGKPVYQFEAHFERDVQERLSERLGRLFRRAPVEAQAPVEAAPDAAPAEALPPAKGTTTIKRSKKSAPDVGVVEDVAASEQPSLPLAAQAPAAAMELGAEDTDPEVEQAHSHTLMVDEDDLLDDELDAYEAALEAEAREAGAQSGGPRIVAPSAREQSEQLKKLLAADGPGGILFKPVLRGDFELPPLSYLAYEDSTDAGVEAEVLKQMAAQIEKTLRDFKVDGQIRDICPGPVITVFEFSPAAGVKLSKIATLADDLAMALSALSVRIVAPIPGKGVVGIEVPNPTREMVFMKEILAAPVFVDNTKMALPMGLGKDTSGHPIVTDLAKMPHLLVAGSTGSGKSVAVNTMITSLLYKNSPDDVRMIMVDPKMLEFSIYADIPHLLLPVVTDPKKATLALNWAVQEMERRYQKLADMSVRNIKGYNQKIEELTKQAEDDQRRGVEDSRAMRLLGLDADGKPEHVRLPYIVVIIDEFADLMMTASKDVETAVARLAQKARAAGIHLILATQRPSTDVITGLIKANFPTRIALRVTSKTDSRVILDSNGAENLLGNGDMLFVPPGSSHIQRVHGAYISETEIEKVVEFLKAQGKPQYDETILIDPEADEEAAAPIEEKERDEHYFDAVRLVVSTKQASISMIQRKLRVGYNRAARMVEMMEIEGLVAPADGCKPREVIADVSPY